MTEIIDGVDYAWSHPGGTALRSNGVRFAARYLSHDVAKNLSRGEADDLAANGLWSVVVWETTSNRAGAGMAAGQADARTAMVQARACGMPDTRPIYFAVDYDAPPSAVAPYFQGVASVLTPARTGVYGGYRVVKSLLDTGVARWAWQTGAWSGGQWDERAVIRQPGSTVAINGVSCDKDSAHSADYGQWMPDKIPNPEEENMPLSPADVDEIKYAILGYRNKDQDAVSVKATGHHMPDVYGLMVNTAHTVTVLEAAVKTLAGLVGTGVDTDKVITALRDDIAKLTFKFEVGASA
jgi:hypothetical protein